MMPESGARQILLIEDNELDARSLISALERDRSSGVRVARATSLEAGLKALHEQQFDCILLDLSLPDSEGLGGVDQVVEAATHCPTVVLTGLDDPTIAITAVAHGAQDYLVKGKTSPDSIERSVRYAMARFATEARLVSTERRLEAVETREQIARDMHDTVIQRLFATGMSLQAGVRSSPEDLRERVGDAVGEIDEAIGELRRAIFELHTPVTVTLADELRSVVESWREPIGFVPSLTVEELPVLDDSTRHDLVAAANEALSNVARHSRPDSVRVHVGAEGSLVSLLVEHSGTVVAPAADRTLGSGRGLENLRARAASHRGDFDLVVETAGSRLRFTVHAPS